MAFGELEGYDAGRERGHEDAALFLTSLTQKLMDQPDYPDKKSREVVRVLTEAATEIKGLMRGFKAEKGVDNDNA